MNIHLLLGRVCSEPEWRGANNKTLVFRLKVDESTKKGEKWSYHSIACWDNVAELVDKTVREGSLVYLEGPSRTRKTDEGKYFTSTLAYKLEVLDGGRSEAPRSSGESAPARRDTDESDIPF